jgi:hypothetical protein
VTGIFDDHRRVYGALLLLGSLTWSLRAGRLEPADVWLTLALGACLAVAGAGLLLRRRWSRALGVGAVLSLVAHGTLEHWLVGGEVGAWRVVVTLATLWAAFDLARLDVTEAEERARRDRADAERRLEAGRLRAKLAHLREHLEAVEEQVRGAHDAEGHLAAFEDCADDDCSQLRDHLAETWAKLDGARPDDDGSSGRP